MEYETAADAVPKAQVLGLVAFVRVCRDTSILSLTSNLGARLLAIAACSLALQAEMDKGGHQIVACDVPMATLDALINQRSAAEEAQNDEHPQAGAGPADDAAQVTNTGAWV